MIFTKEMALEVLDHKMYGTLVTMGERGLTSRTMSFGYLADDKVFFLTHKGSSKLSDINFSQQGLFHISNINNDDLINSIDISVEGDFQLIEYDNPLFKAGTEILGKKNSQVKDLLNSDGRESYQMILLNIKSLTAWSYLQALSGQPKTVII